MEFTEFKHNVKNMYIKYAFNETHLKYIVNIYEGRKNTPTIMYYDDKLSMLLGIEWFLSKKSKINIKKEEQSRIDKLIAEENRSKVNVGDIYYTSWGYDRTITEFFQVVEILSKTKVNIKRIDEIIVSEDYMSHNTKPAKDQFISEVKKVSLDMYGNLVKADEYGHKAYKVTEGKEYYSSWYN